MYIFTVFLGHRISRKLVDLSRHVQQRVLQIDDLESYGPAVHGELGPRFDSSCHGLQMERKSVALVGFLLAEMLAECRQRDRQCVQKTTGACLAATKSKQAWKLRSVRNPTLTYLE
jgi:hypothetical protein